MVRTVHGTDVVIDAQKIESIGITTTGCAVYMDSGTIWHTSEPIDMTLTRLARLPITDEVIPSHPAD